MSDHLAGLVAAGTVTPAEADLIRDYLTEHAATAGTGAAWQHNLYHLVQRAVVLLHDTTGASLEDCTTGDTLATIAAIRARDGSPNYARQQVAALKAFALWLAESRPELNAAKIRAVKMPPARWKNRTPEDMLSRDEVMQIIDACRTARDRCLIAMLYDGSNRPSELLALDWSDLRHDEYGAGFETRGKTGAARWIRLTIAVPYLAAWRAVYPGPPEGSVPVFCNVNRPHTRMLQSSVDRLIGVLRKRTGIARLTSYVFRPSRITHDLEDGLPVTYVSMKNWGTLSTPMLQVYQNLSQAHLDEVALVHAGIRPRETGPKVNPLKPTECPRCRTLNPPGAQGCMQCLLPLTDDAKAGVEAGKHAAIFDHAEELMALLERIKNGKVDLD